MSDSCIYINLDPYLMQWFIHEQGGEIPVKLTRGSTEREMLELFIQTPPKDASPSLPGDGRLAIAIPHFKHKDPRYYNHLSKSATAALVRCIKNRFDIAMWTDLHRFGYIGRQQQEIIFAWMEQHGITPDETNWNAIAKRYQRKRNIYLSNLRKKK